ncbi:MAG: 2-succinyl-5-enolpyruvyl-6-hydroxy-3-cyclohexene-1-carboxylic-acid synthase [Leptolyngbyaceae cyanobacterium]
MSLLDYRNINTLWASVIVETLSRLGLEIAITCPGSRSTPLTIALVRHPTIETIPILDERSAAFFSLGCAKRLHQPVVLVCTSGTAGANFYPAIIEAQESHVPLVVFTADRPPELRDCGSGQTIDQQKLFGGFVNWYTEMAVPNTSLLNYVRQTMVHAWHRALSPKPGPVHINGPFRDPLSPVSSPTDVQLNESEFFSAVFPRTLKHSTAPQLPKKLWEHWSQTKKGIIIAGPAQPQNPHQYCQSVANLSQSLGWPILAEGLSPLRNYQSLNPYLISTYDCLLRSSNSSKQLAPEQVIQLGPLPTSKIVRQWLQRYQPLTWQVTSHPSNVDPLHGRTYPIEVSVEAFGAQSPIRSFDSNRNVSEYCQQWISCEKKLRQKLTKCLQSIEDPFEGKISWLLSQYLPKESVLVVANSMPVRDIESFWQPNDRHIQPYFNRGANGIDGTLSASMGIAHGYSNSVLLTGDLAFLHDINGLLNHRYIKGKLTILVINNQGGGIFEMLPISEFEPPFEEYFATPQAVDLLELSKAYGVQHSLIRSWDGLIECLKELQADDCPKFRVLELLTDRKADAKWRKMQLASLADGIQT